MKIRHFNKGEGGYQVLLSTSNDLCYLLILKSVVQDIHENCSDLNRKVPPINSKVPGTLGKH